MDIHKTENEMKIVTCSAGTYRGRVSAEGVSSFLGIRYGQAPVGRLRWQPPRPVSGGGVVNDALEYGNPPIQRLNPGTWYSTAGRMILNKFGRQTEVPKKMDEDCLYLNIWTGDNGKKKKPVLVWIFGGAYIQGDSGSPEACGERLAARYPELVVVSINYRLGVLGSINLDSLDETGEFCYSKNLAILDQQEALRWIHENIEAFGGDRENVTLCGHSAGSNAITHHLTSETSGRLFRRAICQSSFLPGAGSTSLEDSRKIGDAFIRLSGASSMEELLALPAARLCELQQELMRMAFPDIKSKLFSPVADGLVLPVDGYERLIKGAAADKEVLLGCSSGEMDSLLEGQSQLEMMRDVILKRCGVLESMETLRDVEKRMSSQAIPERTERECLMDVYNDINIRIPGLLMAKALSKKGICYTYYCNWWYEEDNCRAYHGVINPLLFGGNMEELLPEKLCASLRETWIHFIKNGNPNNEQIPKWEPYTELSPRTMIIDREWRLEEGWKSVDEEILLPFFTEWEQLKGVETNAEDNNGGWI